MSISSDEADNFSIAVRFLEVLKRNSIDTLQTSDTSARISNDDLDILIACSVRYCMDDAFIRMCNIVAYSAKIDKNLLLPSPNTMCAVRLYKLFTKPEGERSNLDKAQIEAIQVLLGEDKSLRLAYLNVMKYVNQKRHTEYFGFPVDDYPQLCAEWAWLVNNDNTQTNLVPTVRERRTYLQDRLNIDILFQQALTEFNAQQNNPNSR